MRRATHAGSWYTDSPERARQEMNGWLEGVQQESGVKAVVGPHAGWTYCGHVLAHTYGVLTPSQARDIERVILLGPSHHVPINRPQVSAFKAYETPIGSLQIDEQLVQKLINAGLVNSMSAKVDEMEHAFEIHAPFIKHLLPNAKFCPIMLGDMGFEEQIEFGKALVPQIPPKTLLAVSTDFCHWGRRFGYTFGAESDGLIHENIEKLDRKAMDILESPECEAEFQKYLDETGNTICGRHALAVLVTVLHQEGGVKWTAYDQSSQVTHVRDSSVSYAAGWV